MANKDSLYEGYIKVKKCNPKTKIVNEQWFDTEGGRIKQIHPPDKEPFWHFPCNKCYEIKESKIPNISLLNSNPFNMYMVIGIKKGIKTKKSINDLISMKEDPPLEEIFSRKIKKCDNSSFYLPQQ